MQNIISKLQSIKTEKHIFNLKKFENEKEFTYSLIVGYDENKRYFIGYVKYYLSQNKIVNYKDLYIGVDRLYFLEFANILIDDEERFSIFMTLIGKREFSSNKEKINTYLIDENSNVEWIKNLTLEDKTLLKQDTTKFFYYKSFGKNINMYEVFFLEEFDKHYILLIQQNIAISRVVERNFIVEFSKEDFDKVLNLKIKEDKVNFIFSKIGQNYLNSIKYKSIEIDGDLIENILNYQLNSDKIENEFNIILKNSPLKREAKLLQNYFSNINSLIINILKDPNNINNIVSLALNLKDYAKILENDSNFKVLQLEFSHLYENITSSKKLFFSDRKLRELIVDMLEIMDDWHQAILKSEDDFKIKFITEDLIKILNYINSYSS